MSEDPIKQILIIRKDLKMRRGKEIAQGAHAAMAWLLKRIDRGYDKTDPSAFYVQFSQVERLWMDGDYRKVVCQVDGEAQLIEIHNKAIMEYDLQSELIIDNGLTEFDRPTFTAVAIGPDYSSRLDPLTKNLKLY